jgi:hypothetical protein
MNRLEELVAELVAGTPRSPDVHALRSRIRRRRVTRFTTALLVVTTATAGIVAIARSVGDKRSGPAVVISPPASVPATSSSTIGPTPRDADANGPALEVPTGTALCQADELEVAPNPALQLIRLFNRSGRSCGLAGFVSVYGRIAAGPWRAVKSVPFGTRVTNGPRWTGVFDPNLTAVISIEPAPAAGCVARSAPTHFTGLRLTLPRDAGTIDIDTIQFEVTNCPLAVSPVEADSQDN